MRSCQGRDGALLAHSIDCLWSAWCPGPHLGALGCKTCTQQVLLLHNVGLLGAPTAASRANGTACEQQAGYNEQGGGQAGSTDPSQGPQVWPAANRTLATSWVSEQLPQAKPRAQAWVVQETVPAASAGRGGQSLTNELCPARGSCGAWQIRHHAGGSIGSSGHAFCRVRSCLLLGRPVMPSERDHRACHLGRADRG